MADGVPLHVADLWIRGGRIASIGRPPDGASVPDQTIDAGDCYVLPGFVQTHLHLVQTLIRNEAEEMPLLEWLRRAVWPFEAAHDEFTIRAAARTGIAECIHSGVTTIFDMGTTHGHEFIFDELIQSGIRAVSGKAMMDLDLDGSAPLRLRETTHESLASAELLASKFDGAADGRIRYCYAPRFALSATPELHREVARRAKATNRRIHTHASEQLAEVAAVTKQFGKSCIRYLHSAGLADAGWTIAHGIHVDGEEIQLIKNANAGVAHCPTSNLKLGSGICNVPLLRANGVAVGLGSDGAPCNNRLDLFREMSLACLLQKRDGNIQSLPARDVVRMATIEGAHAIGMDSEIGSLAIGKRADVIVIDPRLPSTSPGRDPYTTIVHAASPENVRDVICDGEVLKLNFVATRFDPREIAMLARDAGEKLRVRAESVV
ncbi:MAG: amidohydrolase family protein [Planctomycetota bacterium]